MVLPSVRPRSNVPQTLLQAIDCLSASLLSAYFGPRQICPASHTLIHSYRFRFTTIRINAGFGDAQHSISTAQFAATILDEQILQVQIKRPQFSSTVTTIFWLSIASWSSSIVFFLTAVALYASDLSAADAQSLSTAVAVSSPWSSCLINWSSTEAPKPAVTRRSVASGPKIFPRSSAPSS